MRVLYYLMPEVNRVTAFVLRGAEHSRVALTYPTALPDIETAIGVLKDLTNDGSVIEHATLYSDRPSRDYWLVEPLQSDEMPEPFLLVPYLGAIRQKRATLLLRPGQEAILHEAGLATYDSRLVVEVPMAEVPSEIRRRLPAAERKLGSLPIYELNHPYLHFQGNEQFVAAEKSYQEAPDADGIADYVKNLASLMGASSVWATVFGGVSMDTYVVLSQDNWLMRTVRGRYEIERF